MVSRRDASQHFRVKFEMSLPNLTSFQGHKEAQVGHVARQSMLLGGKTQSDHVQSPIPLQSSIVKN